MFIKAFKVKNNIQVKGSDVKKLKTRLSQQYKSLSESELSVLLPSKSSFQAVKVITHAEDQVTIHTVDKRPMFFELQDRLFPTVYSCWLVPSILFHFTTHPPVLPKLANGANLMLPGIVKEGGDLKSFGRFQREQVVAVNLTSNRSCVAVGTLAKDSEDMYMSGGHGVCVNILHVFGDKLWGFEPTVTLQIPLSQPVLKAPQLNNNDDFPALGSEQPKKSEPVTAAVQQQLENLNVNGDDGACESSEEEEESSFDPDEALKRMFLSALKLQKKELSGLLPIIVAVFYPTYVLKQVQPNPDKPVTIKETSYKKVSTFIKKMAEEGFVVVREENKGVEKITSINYEHPQLVSHIPLKQSKSDESKGEQSSHLMLTKMTELFVVNEATKKMFNALGVGEGKSLDSSQIKNYVKDYVSRKKLLNSVTKEVTLDDVLVEICVGQRENEAPIVMLVEQVISIVNSRMETTFEMRSQSAPLIKGGKKPIIQISTATRMGNKKVTLITNLEAYGINVAEFSKACKIGVQASTSITKVSGTSINQFQIQGNHVRFIFGLLTDTYQIAKSNITGLEFAKKEKTSKKK